MDVIGNEEHLRNYLRAFVTFIFHKRMGPVIDMIGSEVGVALVGES